MTRPKPAIVIKLSSKTEFGLNRYYIHIESPDEDTRAKMVKQLDILGDFELPENPEKINEIKGLTPVSHRSAPASISSPS